MARIAKVGWNEILQRRFVHVFQALSPPKDDGNP